VRRVVKARIQQVELRLQNPLPEDVVTGKVVST
jgi:hypothetical protein